MKYRDIKKNTAVSTYQNNLFIAVSDAVVDMVVSAGISPSEARRLVLRDVNATIKEIFIELNRRYKLSQKKLQRKK